MTIKLETVERQFIYNGRILPDPDATLTPDEVRSLYAAVHPDLLNATVIGGDFDGNVQQFEFRRAVGDKG